MKNNYWSSLYKDLEDIPKKIELVILLTEQIYNSNVSLHSKKMRRAYIPHLKDISTETFCKEVLYTKNYKLNQLHIGPGYNDLNALVERTYSSYMGIKYNYSDWKLLNLNNLNNE